MIVAAQSATIALIAHDRKKDDMVAFAQRHASVLSKYRLITTGTTGQRLQQGTNLPIEAKLSGPLGGDAQIAAEVTEGNVVAVIFFVDPLYAQPHEPDIRALLRICEVHNVPFATNIATANAVLAMLRGVRVAHLIFNPVSGQGNPQQELLQIRTLLSPQMHLHVHVTQPEDDPTKLAKDAIAEGAELVIASGGDGTVSAVAGALIGTNIPLGVIPRGTANAFAVAMGIPNNIQGACETILAGLVQTVDAARCNGLPMILLAGVGFEAETVERANRETKNRWGTLAYIFAGIQQLREQALFDIEVDVDGKVSTLKAAAITIANAAPPTSVLAQGSGQVIASDGMLDITIGSPNTPWQAIEAMINLLGAALVKTETNREDIVRLQAKRIKVTAEPPQKVVVDGEILGTTPIEVECLPNSLAVLAPPQAIAST